MRYILTYWLASILDTPESFIPSEDLSWLMDRIGTRNDNGESWLLHIEINGACYLVGDSEEYRGDLTNKIKVNKAYKAKDILKLRDKFIKKYDEKGLKPTK